MADEAAYLDCCRFALRTVADTVVVGLVPLTKRLDTTDPARMEAFAGQLLALARESGKRLGVVVEGGPLFEAYRQTFMKCGVPLFLSMEKALSGLQLLAEA
jgi:hypothetical protein